MNEPLPDQPLGQQSPPSEAAVLRAVADEGFGGVDWALHLNEGYSADRVAYARAVRGDEGSAG